MTDDDKINQIFQTEESHVTIRFSEYNWIHHKHVLQVISTYTLSEKYQKASSTKIILEKATSHS